MTITEEKITETEAPIAPEVSIELELITPAQAAEWLETSNTHNRRIRPNQTKNLSWDMEEGNWYFTGDTIKFSPDGVLLDGQHRLKAIVESGSMEWLIVVRGIDPRAQAAIDTQSRRMAYDALKLRGVEGDMKNAAAVARGVFMYDHGRVPTQLETVTYVEDHADDIADAVEVSEMVRRAGRLTGGSFYGIAYYLLARVDANAARDFFEKLAGGYELGKGDPILLLLKHLSKGLPYGFGRGSWHLRQNLALVFTSWNAWRQGKQLHQMRVPKEMPEPI